MERNLQRAPVTHGSHVIGSVRGTSSHQYNPMMILADEHTTEEQETAMQCRLCIVEIFRERQ